MIVTNLLTLHNQLKIHHWQTKSYAQHQAFGSTYDAFTPLIDEFVEVFMGKYGRIKSQDGFSIKLLNLDSLSENELIEKYIKYFTTDLTDQLDKDKDTDLLNLRDEMLSELNKLKYLLTLD